MPSSFLNFSVDEVAEGLEYAKSEHGLQLDRDTLRELANKTGIRWCNEGRNPARLQNAKRLVMNDLWQFNHMDQCRRDAYSAAAGKMFSRRSALARASKKAAKERRAVAKPVRHPGFDPTMIGFDPKTNQGVFLFGSERH